MDAKATHLEATVVDTHNDLIWLVDLHDRRADPTHFAEYWLPELRAGGVDVQVLPICLDKEFQSEGGLRRTLRLVERIHTIAADHTDDVALCHTAAEIDAAVAAGKIALVIALEGAHGIGQDPELIRTMARVGVRMVSLAHFGRTFLADGSLFDATSRGRLTPQGIEVMAEMERLGVVFDISHLGAAGVDHALELVTRPLVASHSACRHIVDHHRNLADDQLRGIAERGGVVCVAAAVPHFIDPTRPTAERVVDHIEHVIATTGIDHVGVGPDFMADFYQFVYGGTPVRPGWAATPPAEIARPSDLPKITEVLVRRGFGDTEIRAVLGGNVMRVFRQVLGIPAAVGGRTDSGRTGSD